MFYNQLVEEFSGRHRDSPFLAVHCVSISSEVDDTEHLYVQVRMGHGCADRVRIAMLCFATHLLCDQSIKLGGETGLLCMADLKLLLDNGVLLVLHLTLV